MSTRILPTLLPFVRLTRPRILALVVFTALPSILWNPGAPARSLAGLVLATILLGASCDAFNALIERRTDGLMERTRLRPLPAGQVAPAGAALFGALAGLLALGLLATAGWLALAVGAAILVHYVLVYSLWLKRRTPLNIVIGGAAGAAAPLLADAVLAGRLTPGSIVLAVIVFTWTPPHFWSIALYRRTEYAAAGIPMLPCVVGDEATRRRMLTYAVLLVPVSLAPVAAGVAGAAYGISALALGACFVTAVVRSMKSPCPEQDRRTFRASVRYLGLLVAVLAAETLLAR